MKPSVTFIAVVGLLIAGIRADAAELVVGQAAMHNLGIEFSAARTVDAVSQVSARAYVVIPPSSEYVISSTVPGLVSRVLADIGQSVSAGQPLLEIRSSVFLTEQQEYLESVHLAVLADAQLERDRQLAEEGIIAERRLEETRARSAAASGRRSEHRQMLLIAGMRARDVEQLEETGVLRDTLVVRAPIDGVILSRSAKAGESVDSLASLFRMADLSELWLNVMVPQENIGIVEEGLPVAVQESFVQRPGRVVSIAQSVDSNTQTVPVRVRLTESGHGLKPGQLVSTSILSDDSVGASSGLCTIPASALFRSVEKSYVFVRAAGGVDVREVTPVGAAGDQLQVRGIEAGADVVVRGVSALKALWLGHQDSGS